MPKWTRITGDGLRGNGVELLSDNDTIPSTISQIIPTDPATDYELTFVARLSPNAQAPDKGEKYQLFSVRFGSKTCNFTIDFQYRPFSCSSRGFGRNDQLTFTGYHRTLGFIVDNVSLVPTK